MPLSIPPDYVKLLMRRWGMVKMGILPTILKMTFEKYPLPVHQPPLLSSPEIPPCSSPLPCTEPESSKDDQTENDSLERPTGGQEEEQLEISLAVRPDMTEEMLRKATEARVNRRLLRYYLIVLLLSNIFTLACLLLSSISYDTGHLMTVKSPLLAAPCRPCHGNSEILDRRSFRSDAPLI